MKKTIATSGLIQTIHAKQSLTHGGIHPRLFLQIHILIIHTSSIIPPQAELTVKKGEYEYKMKAKQSLLIIIPVLVAGITFSLASGKLTAISPFFQLGEKIAWEKNHKENEQVILLVNGEPITRKDFNIQKILLEAGGIKATDEEIINKLIETQVLYQEAKKRHLVPDLKEAEAFAQQQKQMLTSHPKPENADLILEYIKGQGLTIDEFFSQNIEGYQKGLALANLRSTIEKEQEEKSGEQINAAAREQNWNDFKQKLIKQAKIEYIN